MASCVVLTNCSTCTALAISRGCEHWVDCDELVGLATVVLVVSGAIDVASVACALSTRGSQLVDESRCFVCGLFEKEWLIKKVLYMCISVLVRVMGDFFLFEMKEKSSGNFHRATRM